MSQNIINESLGIYGLSQNLINESLCVYGLSQNLINESMYLGIESELDQLEVMEV